MHCHCWIEMMGIFACFRTNVVMNYTEVETKVREATTEEAWGPTGTQMQELAQYSFTYEYYAELMTMLWRRMLYDNRNCWRRVYKVDYLYTISLVEVTHM